MIIAVLDSGYSGKRLERIVGGISVSVKKGGVIVKDDFCDVYGHGTAVTDLLINQCAENVRFYIVRILQEDGSCNPDVLQEAMQYILGNIECDLIHISAGVERLDNGLKLYEIISRLNNKGVYVIASFANSGAVSYPAAFDNVIGVDMSGNDLKKEQYEAVEGSIIDFRASSSFYRVNWIDKIMIVSGSSFCSVTITAKITSILANKNVGSLNEIKEYLKMEATNIYECKDYPQLVSAAVIAKKIKRAIVFPFNKEVFQVAGNEKLCGGSLYKL